MKADRKNSFIKHVSAIAYKEAMHIMRDPFTLAVAFLLPLFFVVAFGYIIDLDYKNFPVIVNDNDRTPLSRQFIQQAQASGYFSITAVNSPSETDKMLQKNSTQAMIIIPPGFGRKIEKADTSDPAKIQLLADGTDNAGAAILGNYSQGTASQFISSLNKENTGIKPERLELRTRFLFNPDLNSHKFIVPALNTIIIGFLAIVLTAVTVAKEWENGSMELLLSTPVRPAEIVLGKLLPYFCLSFADCLIIFIIAVALFHLPFRGSFALYLAACMIYITGALALGLLISVITRQQQAAIQIGMAVGLLPSIIFSGFIFPIENMPVFFRYLTVVFPQRWYLYISRCLFLSDPSLASMAKPFAALLAFAVIMITAAVKKFKTDVEP